MALRLREELKLPRYVKVQSPCDSDNSFIHLRNNGLGKSGGSYPGQRSPRSRGIGKVKNGKRESEASSREYFNIDGWNPVRAGWFAHVQKA